MAEADLLYELEALKLVLHSCIDQVQKCLNISAEINIKEVFPQASVVKKPKKQPKAETIVPPVPPADYVIKTAGLYYGCSIRSLLVTNSDGLRSWVKSEWKDLDAKDKDYFKQLYKKGE